MKVQIAACIVAACVLSGCQTVPSVAQGRPEHFFTGAKIETIQSALAEMCMNRQAIIDINTLGQVVCSSETDGLQSFVASMLVGGRHGSTPRFKIRFSLVQSQTGVRVQAYRWLESTNAYGRVDTQELTDANTVASELQKIDDALGHQPLK